MSETYLVVGYTKILSPSPAAIVEIEPIFFATTVI